jgi:hypothetical protein
VVFFKVDADSVSVGQNFMLQGTATVVGKPGDHGDLGPDGSVPPATGDFLTVLTAVPVPSLNAFVPGFVGCIALLFDQMDTPDDAVAAGHQAFNNGLQQGLDNLIPTFGPMKETVTQEDIQNIQVQVQTGVENAIKDALSTWQQIMIGLGISTPDSPMAIALFMLNQNDLGASPAVGFPLQSTTDIHGGRFKGDTSGKGPVIISINFSGKAIGDPFPLSLKRILTGLGYQLPVPILEAMGGSTPNSITSWLQVVR